MAARMSLSGTEWKGSALREMFGLLASCTLLGPDRDFRLSMVVMSSLRAILQASPCRSPWRRFQIPSFLPARPCSLYTCTYKARNRAWFLRCSCRITSCKSKAWGVMT
ncbi:uncharacterized protein LOC120232894 [Hyaena hyaena]|uniref:uncharacterized protein LOC120232894 n=1 Tax=Hyaena hyaena TaxID=95912 RepID=UPI001922C3CB|nr:uncharacterized protein LOC120232894 [Hyaena hyaena]